jgi:CBS domain containing-hemolysin-like protein
MRLSDLEDQLGAAIDHPEAETVAGLVLEQLQHIPVRGEAIEWEGFRLTVVASDERRVKLVAIESLQPAATSD